MTYIPGADGSSAISSSSDVALNNVAHNDTLVYDSALEKWTNAEVALADGTITDAKVAVGAGISLDKTVDSATRLAMTAEERTKLAGIADGATGSLYITPEDEAYGAVGDGVADDTAAIQAAFDASAGQNRTVLLRGQYRCTASLNAAAGMSVYLDKGARLIKEFSGAAVTNAFIRNAGGDASVKTSNIRITGPGMIGAASHAHTGQIIGLHGDDIYLSDFTIDTYAGGQAIIIAGDRNRIHGLTIRNSSVEIGTGAIRMVGGTDFIATNCHAESGDDVFQFVPIASPSSPLYDMSISRSAYIGCTGVSSVARLFAVGMVDKNGVGGMAGSVTDCSFIACHGKATERGIYIINDDSTGAVRNIGFIDCSIDMTGAETGYQTVFIRRDSASYAQVGPIDNIRFTGLKIVNSVGINFAFQGLPSNILFDGCEFSTPSDGTATSLANGGDVDGLILQNCVFRGHGATQTLFFGNNTQPSNRVIINGCRFYDLSLTTGAINFDAVIFGRILNCTFLEASSANTARAVRVGASSSQIFIEGNDMGDLTVAGKITNLATDTVVRDNVGYNTDNSGTATVAAASTTVTVVHGLLNTGRTPSEKHITLTPTSSLGAAARYWVSNVTGTNFQINVDVAPGGADATFAWRIDTGRL